MATGRLGNTGRAAAAGRAAPSPSPCARDSDSESDLGSVWVSAAPCRRGRVASVCGFHLHRRHGARFEHTTVKQIRVRDENTVTGVAAARGQGQPKPIALSLAEAEETQNSFDRATESAPAENIGRCAV